jgi:hypothetical protein
MRLEQPPLYMFLVQLPCGKSTHLLGDYTHFYGNFTHLCVESIDSWEPVMGMSGHFSRQSCPFVLETAGPSSMMSYLPIPMVTLQYMSFPT